MDYEVGQITDFRNKEQKLEATARKIKSHTPILLLSYSWNRMYIHSIAITNIAHVCLDSSIVWRKLHLLLDSGLGFNQYNASVFVDCPLRSDGVSLPEVLREASKPKEQSRK